MAFYDVTVIMSGDLPVYPGERGISIVKTKAIEKGDGMNLSHLSFGAHTGTHIDAPAHFYKDGATVLDLPLDVLIGPAIVVETPPGQTITAELLSSLPIAESAERILFKTGSSRLLYQPAFSRDFVAIEPSGARWLVERGVKLVGIDYLSVEEFGREPAETHLMLLGAGVVIVEGLDLSNVEAGTYEFVCLPLRISAEGSPVRAVLIGQGAKTEQ
jgi:arylformamidase